MGGILQGLHFKISPTTMSMLRYIELKSGFGDKGPAWIGRVTLSRSKTTVYFNGRGLKKTKGGGMSGNYVDIETGETYWISGVKKNGADRHWAGSGPILVEQEAVAEYLLIRGMNELDSKYYVVTDSIIQTDIDRIKKIENPNKWDFDAEENTP